MATREQIAGAIGESDDYTTEVQIHGHMKQGDREIGSVHLCIKTEPTVYMDAAAHRAVEIRGLAAFLNGLADAGWQMAKDAGAIVEGA